MPFGRNRLVSLDVSQNPELTYLFCSSNQLTTLDVSICTKLMFLSCDSNPGDGVSTFPITAWFDNDTKPTGLNVSEEWVYGDKTIHVDFRKAE